MERPEWVLIEFSTPQERTLTLRNNTMVGRICLHEIDHLDGILLSDKAKERIPFSQIQKEEDFLKFFRKNRDYLDLVQI